MRGSIRMYLGPPGCGKTETLLNESDAALSSGTRPEDVGFVSFTKRAVWEAVDRAAKRFDVDSDRFTWYRTLHSVCFQGLGVGRSQMMSREATADFMHRMSLPYSGASMTGDELVYEGSKRGDRLLFCMNLARLRCVDPKQQWRETGDDEITWVEQRHFNESYERYTRTNSLVDFTGLLERFVSGEGHCPSLRALFVDEAQDLSRLQWRVIERLSEGVDNVVVAGDDDQAIYEWAGADVETFLSMPGKKVVLTHSHRLPEEVHALATSVSRRIRRRYRKEFYPNGERGSVRRVVSAEDLDLSSGSWLVLARNGYLLNGVERVCRENGYLFQSKRWSPSRSPAVEAMRLWERLRSGASLTLEQVQSVYRYMRVGSGVARGYKGMAGADPNGSFTVDDLERRHGLRTRAIWHEALERIPADEREFFLVALRSGERLSREPRVTLSTIHGAKGAEADNVALITDVAYRTWARAQEDPDPETRVTYVGITRTKKNLFIVEPNTVRFMDI